MYNFILIRELFEKSFTGRMSFMATQIYIIPFYACSTVTFKGFLEAESLDSLLGPRFLDADFRDRYQILR